MEDVLFQVVGDGGRGQHDMIFSLAGESLRVSDADLRLEWARQKMYDLIGRYTATRSEAVLQEMAVLSKRFGLSIPYAYDLTTPVRP